MPVSPQSALPSTKCAAPSIDPALQANVPTVASDTPALIDFKHSRNLACAARSFWKEEVRCSSSSSNCFFTWLSCCALREARSTVWPEEHSLVGFWRLRGVDGSCLSGLEEGRRRTWCERLIGYRMSLLETTGVVTKKVVVVGRGIVSSSRVEFHCRSPLSLL